MVRKTILVAISWNSWKGIMTLSKEWDHLNFAMLKTGTDFLTFSIIKIKYFKLPHYSVTVSASSIHHQLRGIFGRTVKKYSGPNGHFYGTLQKWKESVFWGCTCCPALRYISKALRASCRCISKNCRNEDA